MIQFLVHEQADNVGVATVDIKAGETASGLYMDSQKKVKVKALQDIPLGHKIALTKFKKDDAVIKYGHDIGTHRGRHQGGRARAHSQSEDQEVVTMAKIKNPKVFAYRRENGRVGIRNHVVILPLDDLSNAACEKVANNVKGTKAIPHAYGRLQFGEDLELFFRTMIGTGANPNVAAVVVIGIEPEWTNRIVEGIAKTGKPVAGFSIERFGEFKTVEMACWKAKEYVQWASELRREPSATSRRSGSASSAARATPPAGLASNPTVGNAIDKLVAMGATSQLRRDQRDHRGRDGLQGPRGHPQDRRRSSCATFNAYQNMIDDNKTDDLSGSQPTKGNIRGGLTTIEEKAFGNLQKIGKKAKYVGVLDKAEAPTRAGAVVHGHLQLPRPRR